MSKFRFSPSTLDRFQRLIDCDAYFESDFNWTNDGPKQSLDELIAEAEQSLLDLINKAPQEPIEEAARGTAFNELVDITIKVDLNGEDANAIKTDDRVQVLDVTDTTATALCDGFTFTFDLGLISEVAIRMKDATMQLHASAMLDVDGHQVKLHGYPDYILADYVVDLKTTGSYSFGKYERYWQRYAYPYILQKSGLMKRCEMFEFLAVEMKRDKTTGIINGTVASEDYTDVSVYQCERELRWICAGLIAWLEAHRDKITNKKIFSND